MKLYTANGQYVGTQAEAKAITKDWREAHIPIDKPGLIAFLNDLAERGRQMPAAVATAPTDVGTVTLAHSSTPPVKPADIAASRTLHTAQAQALTIEEAIAEADYPRAIRLAEHIHCRLMEHGRAAEPGK